MARYSLPLGDCFSWMDGRAQDSVHAMVTDPPYGLKEYTPEEKEKLRNGHGGVWRIPPSFDGCKRSPLPRFTVLNEKDRERLRSFSSNSLAAPSACWSPEDTSLSPLIRCSPTSSTCRSWRQASK